MEISPISLHIQVFNREANLSALAISLKSDNSIWFILSSPQEWSDFLAIASFDGDLVDFTHVIGYIDSFGHYIITQRWWADRISRIYAEDEDGELNEDLYYEHRYARDTYAHCGQGNLYSLQECVDAYCEYLYGQYNVQYEVLHEDCVVDCQGAHTVTK